MKESLISSALDSIPAPIFLVDYQDKIVYINETFEKEFGNVAGKDYPEVLTNNQRLKDNQKQLVISKEGRVYSLDLSMYKNMNGYKLKVGILKDITELKRLKEYIQYLEDLNKEINHIYKKQRKLIDNLYQQALTDGLTGLYNYRHFWEQVNVELKRANRYSESLSCIMIDIDNFKFVNDRFDHQFGDSVLKKIADILKSPLRATDILARYGGDEFSILLPNTDYQGSQVISSKILGRVRQSMFAIKDSSAKVTISVGVSSYPVDQISNSSQLVEYADMALYDAKAKGKDRVSFFHDLKPTSLH